MSEDYDVTTGPRCPHLLCRDVLALDGPGVGRATDPGVDSPNATYVCATRSGESFRPPERTWCTTCASAVKCMRSSAESFGSFTSRHAYLGP